jgi:hypothetical protein
MKPARNRVSPRGNIIAVAGRGAWMGNRGRLHEGAGTRDIVRNYRSKAWITCLLEFRGRYTRQWDPTHYTQLFFLDEAVAFAAGHRPCAECRRADYNAYRQAWVQKHGGALPYAKDMDTVLHRERLHTHRMPWNELPDGVFVETDDGPAVIAGDHLTVFDEQTYTYGQRRPRPVEGLATVITPPANVAVIRAGYPVQIDQSGLGSPSRERIAPHGSA